MTCTITNNDIGGKLTLVKTVTNDNGGTALPTAWTLAAAGPTAVSGVTGAAAVTNAAVNAGVYTLSESGGPAGYAASVWSCTGATVSNGQFTMPLNGNVSCTINNNDIGGKLTLKKIVSSGPDDPTAWTLSATGPTNVSGVTGAAAVTNAAVNAGAYTLAESGGPAGYTASDWACQGTGGTPTAPNKVTLALGSDVTCTITNSRDTGQLEVIKVIRSAAGDLTNFTISVDGTPLLIDAHLPGEQITLTDASTGSHTITEAFGAGGGDSADWIADLSACGTNGVVQVTKGQKTTCTITNSRKPKLTVVKKVVGGTGDERFDLFVGIDKVASSVGDGGSGTKVFTTEATAAVSEALAGTAGIDSNVWDVSYSTECDNTGHTVALKWGDAKTCTITNTKRPKLTITKNIVGNGSFDVFDGFNQAAALNDASLATQSVTRSYPAGTAVDVTETMSNGSTPVDANAWTVVKTGDCKLTLAAGAVKSCTIDNKQRPTVLVKKIVVGGTAKPGDFKIGIAATNADTTSVTGSNGGTVVTVDPGTFKATESNPSPLYTVSYSADCGQSQPVAVAFGEPQRTCTVTNTRKPSGITVTKTEQQSEIAEPGGQVMFDVVVHNDSTADTVTITTLTDDPDGSGPAVPTSLDGVGSCSLPQTLLPGKEFTCSFSLVINGNAGDSKTDVVAAAGTDAEGRTVSDDDDATVRITDVAPSIVVTKVASPSSMPEPGGDVVFTVTVKNTSVSSDPVTLTSLVDSVFGNLVDDAANGEISESTCVLGTIAPGDTYECHFKAPVVGNAGLEHSDTVTANGHDDDLPNPDDEVTGSATAKVTLTDVAPSIVVTKVASPSSMPEPGGDVVFTVTVKNTSVSSDPVTLTSLVDSVFGNLVDDAANGEISESTCVLGTIAPGDTYECHFKAPVVGNAGLEHSDTVTANGHDDDLPNPDDEVTGSATAKVTLTDVAPSIVVTKVASPSSMPEPGGDVVFTVTVKNTSVSSDPVTLTSLVDSVFGNLVDDAANGEISESTCVLGTIAPGDTYECHFKAPVVGNAGLEHSDTVTANGHDDDLPNPDDEVTGSATAKVTLTDVNSTIQVTKTPSPSSRPEPGGVFTFEVTIKNTSATDTVTITSLEDKIGNNVRDIDNGDCKLVHQDAEQQDVPGLVLAPGASFTCSFNTTFTSNGPASQSDVVTASGTDDDDNPVSDTAGATVRITDVPSSIAVTKTPNVGSVQAPGGDVTFTVVVKNTSAVDSVTISTLTDSVYGDLNEKGTCAVPKSLAPGGSYECQFTGAVTGAGGTEHVNKVTASGTDDDGHSVTGNATATVSITTAPPPPPPPRLRRSSRTR